MTDYIPLAPQSFKAALPMLRLLVENGGTVGREYAWGEIARWADMLDALAADKATAAMAGTGKVKNTDLPAEEEIGGLGVRTDKYPAHLNDGEREIIDALIRAALEDGWLIRVLGDGEIDCDFTSDYATITEHVGACSETRLVMRGRERLTQRMQFLLVHNNEPWEVIADHSVSNASAALLAKVQPIIDRMETDGLTALHDAETAI